MSKDVKNTMESATKRIKIMNEQGQGTKDSDTLERALAGDRNAREELAAVCLPRVRRTVMLAAGRSGEADDLAQTALARIFGSLHQFKGEARFTTWVDKITINTVREHFRRKSLVRLFHSDERHEREAAPETGGPDRRLEGKRLNEALLPHLMSIKPKKRMALILSTAYGYSVSEIAEMTSCTTETAKKPSEFRSEMLKTQKCLRVPTAHLTGV